ncbi:hypothetical protein BJF86_05295 [Serinicoccus sp. CNJ-927]|uniref:hypothetical protein n=1 Tax=Serinicoccus sp. CNJ-927 TaxID=1904970 RepID=UPI0009645357|nr:hypothetical protein [Serinicoccus sp. CNJ-927]OLT40215.1 hypothetical protein BJF86_05295 [Serinicoccus sp. CNJ-927]
MGGRSPGSQPGENVAQPRLLLGDQGTHVRTGVDRGPSSQHLQPQRGLPGAGGGQGRLLEQGGIGAPGALRLVQGVPHEGHRLVVPAGRAQRPEATEVPEDGGPQGLAR